MVNVSIKVLWAIRHKYKFSLKNIKEIFGKYEIAYGYLRPKII